MDGGVASSAHSSAHMPEVVRSQVSEGSAPLLGGSGHRDSERESESK